MIVDSHVHLFHENSDSKFRVIASAGTGIASMINASGLKGNAEELYDRIALELFDITGDKLVASMDSAGIDLYEQQGPGRSRPEPYISFGHTLLERGDRDLPLRSSCTPLRVGMTVRRSKV